MSPRKVLARFVAWQPGRLFAPDWSALEFLDYLLSPPVTALLCAVVVASARGWQWTPVVLLGLSQLPALYAQANLATLGEGGEAFVTMVGDGVMMGL